MPTEENAEADRHSRPGTEEHVRLRPNAFAALWRAWGSFQVDLMATAQSAQRVPRGERDEDRQLPFFARYACPGACGVDALAQDL